MSYCKKGQKTGRISNYQIKWRQCSHFSHFMTFSPLFMCGVSLLKENEITAFNSFTILIDKLYIGYSEKGIFLNSLPRFMIHNSLSFGLYINASAKCLAKISFSPSKSAIVRSVLTFLLKSSQSVS